VGNIAKLIPNRGPALNIWPWWETCSRPFSYLYSMRLLLVFIGFAALVLLAFALWGDSLMLAFSQEGTLQWLDRFGPWAWLGAIMLLMADLVLPLPATIILSALGFLYGPWLGMLIGTAGSFLAGSLGYWLCRMMGQKTALVLLGRKDFERGQKISSKLGSWIVVLSRWLPVFPEVVSGMAGLTRMNAPLFHLALLTGTLPMAAVYAWVGASGYEHPYWAVGLSMGLPPLIWWGVGGIINRELKNERN